MCPHNNAIGEEGNRNHLMNFTSLEKLGALSLVSGSLEMEYATQFFYSHNFIVNLSKIATRLGFADANQLLAIMVRCQL